MTKYNKLKVGIVLGAGGARGMAHLGVLEVFEQHGIPVSFVVGSSIGSIIGAFYADLPASKAHHEKLLNMKARSELNYSPLNSFQYFLTTSAPFSGKSLEDFINKNITAKDFSELRVPFYVVATDIKDGSTIVFNSGDVGKAVRASSAIPPLFSPFTHEGRTLIDGGFSQPLPVETAKDLNPDVIIAIDISNTMPSKSVRCMADAVYKASYINYYWLSKMQAKLADIAIQPPLDDFDILDEHKSWEIYQIGKDAAIEALPRIIELLDSKLK
jgi:NTE family protein